VAESSLTVDYDYLVKSVIELVFGGGDTTVTYSGLSADEQHLVDRVIESGLRQFYQPPPSNGRSHDWSFLRPIGTVTTDAPYSTGTVGYDHTGGAHERLVTLASGTWPTWAYSGSFPAAPVTGVFLEVNGRSYTLDSFKSSTLVTLPAGDNPGSDIAAGTAYSISHNDYDLPDDFGRLIGSLTFAESNNAWSPIRIVGEGRIRDLRQRNVGGGPNSGKPQFGAVVPAAHDATVGTRQQIQFWPDVSSDYILSFRYRVRPNKLDSANKYAYGASDHSETLLYSCLAEAERRRDGERGPNYNRFMECLASSIEIDSRDNRPEHLGYNGDWSDSPEFSRIRRNYLWGDGVTHKGTGGY